MHLLVDMTLSILFLLLSHEVVYSILQVEDLKLDQVCRSYPLLQALLNSLSSFFYLVMQISIKETDNHMLDILEEVVVDSVRLQLWTDVDLMVY